MCFQRSSATEEGSQRNANGRQKAGTRDPLGGAMRGIPSELRLTPVSAKGHRANNRQNVAM